MPSPPQPPAPAPPHPLQAVVDSLPDLVFELDIDGNYYIAQSQQPELLAAPASQLVGSNIADVLSPEAAAVCLRALAEALEHGSSSGQRYPVDLPEGRRWFELAVSRKLGDDSLLPHFIAVSRDVTTRHLAELELQRLVAERTAELSTAKDAAEAASRAKSVFLANMSHEIRTPLNAVIGMAHMLRRSPLNEQQQGWLQALTGASEHLLEVLNALLDLSKIESGAVALAQMPLDLPGLVDNARTTMQARANAKGLELRTEVPTGLPLLRGDPTRLQQALMNLMNNAVKFTEQGHVTVRVQVADESEPSSVLLRFEVEDTGIGIAPEVQPRLFAAFEQADTSITRSFGGTGLGLAISRRLVSLMGGEIGVRSSPGAGSLFWFTARLAVLRRPPAVPAPSPAADLPASVDPAQQLRSRHAGQALLLVDSDPLNQEVAEGLLDAVGLRLLRAESTSAALRHLQQQRCPLVLLNLQVQQPDALAVARQLRALPALARLPMVALSAGLPADEDERCSAAGIQQLIAQPLDADELYAALLRWLPQPQPSNT